jgi:hypothetical protein
MDTASLNNANNQVKTRRGWSDWLPLWLAWTISTSLGWFGSGLLIMGMAVAYSAPDVDAARIYRAYSAWERVSGPLFTGAIIGILPAVGAGLLYWLALRRKVAGAVLVALATLAGSALLCSAASWGGPQVESAGFTTLRLGVIGGLVGGGFSGVCQCILLKRRLSRLAGWIPLTVLGWAMAWAVAVRTIGLYDYFSRASVSGPFAPYQWPRSADLLLVGLALAGAGALLGLGQWLLLRRSLPRAGGWIVATAISWDVGGGIGLGLITGTSLVWLLRRSPPDR